MNDTITDAEETIIIPAINPQQDNTNNSRELVPQGTAPTRPDLPHATFGGYQRDAVDAYIAELENGLHESRQHEHELAAAVNDLQTRHTLTQRRLNAALDDNAASTQRINALTQERDQARHDAQNSIAAMAEEQQAFVNACRARGQQLMDKAQTEYDAKLRQAGIDAQQTVQDAKEEAASILASAQHTAETITDTAKRKSEAADQRSTQLVEQAKQTAAELIADAHKQQDDIRHECAQQVADAQKETEQYRQLRDRILAELDTIATKLNQLPCPAAHPTGTAK